MALMMLMMIVFVLERHLQAKKALQRPEKLLAEFQTVNGSLEGLFSWQVSETTPGQTPITGFQFSWVKVSSRCVNKSLDTSLISQTLNLAPVSLKAFIRRVLHVYHKFSPRGCSSNPFRSVPAHQKQEVTRMCKY